MLTIDISELKSKKYKAFINYALTTCDYVSFVIDKENQIQNDYLRMLKLNCSQDILNEMFISVHPETGTNFNNGYMITLKCNAYIRTSFFSAYCIEDFNGIGFPEELCFFRNEIIWFKFISHERLSFVLNERTEDVDFFKLNKIYYSR